jgi:hypothetical protein
VDADHRTEAAARSVHTCVQLAALAIFLRRDHEDSLSLQITRIPKDSVSNLASINMCAGRPHRRVGVEGAPCDPDYVPALIIDPMCLFKSLEGAQMYRVSPVQSLDIASDLFRRETAGQ